jgi:hypothetical protein
MNKNEANLNELCQNPQIQTEDSNRHSVHAMNFLNQVLQRLWIVHKLFGEKVDFKTKCKNGIQHM